MTTLELQLYIDGHASKPQLKKIIFFIDFVFCRNTTNVAKSYTHSTIIRGYINITYIFSQKFTV